VTGPEEDTTDSIIAAGIRLAAVDIHERYQPRRMFLVVLAVVAAVGAVYLFTRSSNDSVTRQSAPITADATPTVAASTPAAETLRPTVPVPITTKPPPTTIVPVTTARPSVTTTKATTTTTTRLPVTTTTEFDPSIPGQFPWNYGALVDGTLVLNGVISTQQQADRVRTQAVELFGADRVSGAIAVDPAAGGPTGVVRDDLDLKFTAGSDVIDFQYHPDLDVAVLILVRSPNAKLQVYGYTDNVGDDQQNLELSTRRVQAVIEYFVASGVSRDRIKALPRGEANPIGDNNTAAGRAKNQRTELVFTNLFAG
jgi:outer membrane protein OmpA-like peptidoglycan-associated protein